MQSISIEASLSISIHVYCIFVPVIPSTPPIPPPPPYPSPVLVGPRPTQTSNTVEDIVEPTDEIYSPFYTGAISVRDCIEWEGDNDVLVLLPGPRTADRYHPKHQMTLRSEKGVYDVPVSL